MTSETNSVIWNIRDNTFKFCHDLRHLLLIISRYCYEIMDRIKCRITTVLKLSKEVWPTLSAKVIVITLVVPALFHILRNWAFQ